MDALPTPQQSDHRLQQIELARRTLLGDGAPVGAPRLDDCIARSWRRCLARGQQPQQRISFNAVSRADIALAREANQPLLQAAAPVIRSLARAMADTGYFAILTDAQGVVIETNGPIDRSNRMAHLIARVGVDLSENAVGTTAIGTTLAEEQPMWLHRGEHFFDDTASYSCAGAPLFGPNGRCVGMLDLTGVNVPERPALKHLVAQSAMAIENELLLAIPHHLQLRLAWPGQAPGGDGDGLLCVDANGQITGSNRTAACMLGLVPAGPLPHCSEVFALSSDTLFDAAASLRIAFEAPLWSGLRVQVLARPHNNRTPTMSRMGTTTNAMPLKDLEDSLIRQAVQSARGNVTEAARLLGISRATVYRKLSRKRP